MDFSLPDEEIQLGQLAAQILADRTDNEQLRAIEAQPDRFDEALWRSLAEAGLLGVAMAETDGGMDLGFQSLCRLVEEVGRTVAPVPVIPTLVSGALAISRFANDDQRAALLRGVASGDVLLSAAMIEPRNEDMARPSTVALIDGQDLLLRGTKTCVPFADRAARIVTSARMETGAVVLLLLDPRTEGATLRRQRSTAGEPQFEISLADARVDRADVLVMGGTAEHAARWIHERTSAALCAMATGVADRMMRMTAEYTAEREQFGVKIATFQAVGHRAADCYIDLQCLTLLTQQAVSRLDTEREAGDEVRMAKIWAGDVLHRVSHAAQHLHGGIGVDRDYPLFRYCLWAKQIELTLGSSARLLAELGEGIAAEFGG